jgi:hypothetical protein
MLANLDNEVIFKKAFTDPVVFRGFVKDILGLDIEVGKIETEKQFRPKMAYIDFKLDIFAESKDERVIIEIQRIEYDHNFDRFLHYFLMSVAELQRGAKQYGMDKTVYTIVVLTAPYRVDDRSGKPVLNEVLISQLNPRNLLGEEVDLFGHQLIFLNSYHRDDFTPTSYRDWLDLIYQSINHPEDPQINLAKPAIRRAAEIIEVDNLTPEERADRKNQEAAKAARKVYAAQDHAKGKDEGLKEGRAKGLKEGRAKGLKEGREEGLKEGREEAQKEEKDKMLKNLIAQGILTDEQIAGVVSRPVEEVRKTREQGENS